MYSNYYGLPPMPTEPPPDSIRPPPPPPEEPSSSSDVVTRSQMSYDMMCMIPQQMQNFQSRQSQAQYYSNMNGNMGRSGRNHNKNSKKKRRSKKNQDRSHDNSSFGSEANNSVAHNMSNMRSDEEQVQVNKKGKRKPMSTRYAVPKDWNIEDANKAFQAENEINNFVKRRAPTLILKFPDPELNQTVIKAFSSHISFVHFQQPCTPRYCFAQLNEDADVEAAIEEIQKIKFGAGFIKAELKHHTNNRHEGEASGIDPLTLYIGNLPPTVTSAQVKERFPTANRLDIGFAQKMKYSRYAFVRYCHLGYNTVDEAIEAFKTSYNSTLNGRTMVIRFRRHKGTIGMADGAKPNDQENGEDNVEDNGEDNDDDVTFNNPSIPCINVEEIETNFDIDSVEKRIKRERIDDDIDSLSPHKKIKQERLSDDEDCDSDESGSNGNINMITENYNPGYEEEEEETNGDFLASFCSDAVWDKNNPDETLCEDVKPNVNQLETRVQFSK